MESLRHVVAEEIIIDRLKHKIEKSYVRLKLRECHASINSRRHSRIFLILQKKLNKTIVDKYNQIEYNRVKLIGRDGTDG